MQLLDFAGAYIGHSVTAPGGDGGQCVDLANLYLRDVLLLPHVYRDAADWRTPPIAGLVWVANGPFNYPEAGSLVVWGENARVGTGSAGHIAVVLAANPTYLVTIDQNWPDASPVGLHLHEYTGVLGWLSAL